MVADISAVTYFAPIAIFVLVFVIIAAVLNKTKLLGEHAFLNLFVAFLIATLFVSAAGAFEYVGTIVPWFAVLVVSMVFLLAITGFVGDPMKSWNKGIGAAFVIIMTLVFLVSGFVIFSSLIAGFLPGPTFGQNLAPETVVFLSWLYSPRIAGAILLIIVSALASWVLVKSSK
ncbi:hypothetical protein D6817_01835 [Candidatus Pacearchaeota archaeon]|nr:MAG: hypothetical protein D6817_01835 [Candidatus Pacearchaeota archaeon]